MEWLDCKFDHFEDFQRRQNICGPRRHRFCRRESVSVETGRHFEGRILSTSRDVAAPSIFAALFTAPLRRTIRR